MHKRHCSRYSHLAENLTEMERGELVGLASSLESIADNLPPKVSKLKTALTYASGSLIGSNRLTPPTNRLLPQG